MTGVALSPAILNRSSSIWYPTPSSSRHQKGPSSLKSRSIIRRL